ncbi:MAG: dihydrofolate reductase [Candidatus Curtissbacteria bacterium]|nr:dihydrofolate reductase [Candidatus Curtissbacteria bacterium]
MKRKRKAPKISLIAAIDSKRGIGRDNKLMWHIAGDMKRFRDLTRGHAVIMGRKTYDAIGRPLPNRANIIVTRDRDFAAKGCIVCDSLGEALEVAKKKEREEIFIIGGGQIYTQAMPYADRLYLTIVEGDFGADTFFPPYDEFGKVVREKSLAEGKYRYKFLDLER